MKQLNKKLRIVQKGGLMIEALAMLGLIAVVTPTMYKKSAERTLEVEDINTATTMRTYLNAAESYVNSNYADLIKQNANNKEITDELDDYLPYGYQDKSLYDFEKPKAFVHKNGMNLTAFVTFPAKTAGGLGKERTSRIASLIGSNGGYVTVDNSVEVEEGETPPNKARGVGGIWTLQGGDYDSIVGDVHKNSIVMASSNIISDINGEELESDKYLSRIPEGAGQTPDYRNTMRTDIYMGGMSANETMSGFGYSKHSIRNIKSLIVGAEKASETTSVDPETGEDVTTEDPYGLYIAGGDENSRSNAFIYGTLEAAVESGKPMFKADTEKMVFGMPRDDDENTRAFTVSQDGSIENYGSLDLAKDPANNEVKIGTLGGWEQAGNHSTRVNGSESENYYFHGRRLGSVTIATEVMSDQNIASIMNESRFAVGSDSVDLSNRLSDEHKISGMSDLGTRVMIEGGSNVKGPFVTPDTVDGEGNETSSSKIKYSDTNNLKFPVAVGSNMIVDGVLTARQMDAQHVRMATLSAGSKNIDDAAAGKWLNVDTDGVRIGKMVNNDRSNGAYFNDTEIQIGTHWDNDGGNVRDTLQTDKGAYLRIKANETLREDPEDSERVTTESGTGGDILMGNGAMQFEISDDSRIVDENGSFGNGEVAITSTNKKGSVVTKDSNLTVMRENDPVFSVRGNAAEPTGDANDSRVHGSARDYDVAVHGKMLVTGNADDFREDVNYLSVGGRDEKFVDPFTTEYVAGQNDALVSIVYDGASNTDKENILTINPKKPTHIHAMDPSSTEYYPYDDGRIYMRKGLIEATNNQYDYNKDLENASGVMMASRFVANNPNKKYSDDVTFSDAKLKSDKNDDNTNYYDTYMVNPAYTSVMNDIKLASRGGARLSDIMPDFITKGIYLVTNSYKEEAGYINNMNNNSASAGDGDNRSAFLGQVGAPACPPGYARVITVTPHSFPVGGIPAYLIEDNTYENAENGKELAVADGKVTLPPLMMLNNQLYTATIPDGNNIDLVESWRVLMGYPFQGLKYEDRYVSDTYDNRSTDTDGNKVYWNLVPITTTSIAGYATTYCYFDRVGVGDRISTIPEANMIETNSFHTLKATPWDTGNTDQENYRKSLNDPQLKYNEVW